MTKQRPCDACGGTGERDVALCYCGGLADTCDGCPDCLGLGCYRERERNGSHDCPACSGRGWQSDAMPVSDALADAETLWRFAWDGGAEVGDLTPAYLDAAAVDLREAELLDDFAAPIAQSAARAAFRAVPGLRG